MPAQTPTQIFLSYASDDGAVAEVIYTAFSKLAEELSFELAVIRDIHSFTQGRSLGDEVQTHLRSSDVLFIIYTESLKNSHSWTGYEVGAFGAYMTVENRKKDRRIISLYLDEPPPTVPGMIGIKLNKRSLEDPKAVHQVLSLDRDENLKKFFRDVSHRVIEKRFSGRKTKLTTQVAEQVTALQEKAHKFIDSTVIPLLDAELVKALSGIVSRSAVEQKLFTIYWKKHPGTETDLPELLTGAELRTEKDSHDVFKIFGVPDDRDWSLSRCPRLADMWYRGLAAGTGATGGWGGEGANSDRIPGQFSERVELRRVPV